MHDPRIGRFFATDPLTSQYPWNSPYAFSENNVLAFNELEGLEIGPTKLERENWSNGRKVAIGCIDGTIIFVKTNWEIIKNPPKALKQTAIFSWNLSGYLYKNLMAFVLAPTSEKTRTIIKDKYDECQQKTYGFTISSKGFDEMLDGEILLTVEKITKGDAYDKSVIATNIVLGILSEEGVYTRIGNLYKVIPKGVANTEGLVTNGLSLSVFKKLNWLKKASTVAEIPRGCEAVAKKIYNQIGGSFLEIRPKRGFVLGPVEGTESGWSHHVAVFKDGKVFDKITGSQGMDLEDYIKKFDYNTDLEFKITNEMTVK